MKHKLNFDFHTGIDPQQQAVSWIKNMYGKDQLKIKSLSESDFMKHLELAIQFGAPFLFENVDEELDPMLDPVRSRRPFTSLLGLVSCCGSFLFC